jgi:hypothetical protein
MDEETAAGLTLFVQIDTKVEQTEVTTAIVQIDSGVHFVLIRHDISAIAFLVGNKRIERDVISSLFCPQEITSGVGWSCFQGKAIGRPDGGKIRFKRDVGSFVFVAASAFTGESKPNYCDQQSTDERSAHQFPPFYSSWF